MPLKTHSLPGIQNRDLLTKPSLRQQGSGVGGQRSGALPQLRGEAGPVRRPGPTHIPAGAQDRA